MEVSGFLVARNPVLVAGNPNQTTKWSQETRVAVAKNPTSSAWVAGNPNAFFGSQETRTLE